MADSPYKHMLSQLGPAMLLVTSREMVICSLTLWFEHVRVQDCLPLILEVGVLN